MAQYPNYLNPSYQQLTNYQNYGYQPMQMDRFSQLQQFQQSLQQPQMQQQPAFAPLGKIVESLEIVKATDIPMDGNMYYFPKADGSEIYAKHWLQNGKTEILTFKPVLEEHTINSAQNEEKLKLGALDEFTELLESKLEEFYKKISSSKSASRAKKEVNDDE